MSLSRGEAYAIVELPIGADPDSIRTSYKRLALKWHPDKHRGVDYNEALWKFQQVSKAYKRLITDRDVTSMTPEEMYQLYQQTFHKPQPVAAPAYSNGCDDSNDDSDEDSHEFSKEAEGTSTEARNNGETLTEEERERRRVEKRKAKKKLRREKKKMEKQADVPAKKEDGKGHKSAKSKDSAIDSGNNKTDAKLDSSASASDSENFDSNSAFYSQVITKKRRSAAAILNNNSAYDVHHNPTQHHTASSSSSKQKTIAEDGKSTSQQNKSDDTWDHIDPVVLRSRQLAIQGNEMANCGHYCTAIDLFTDAIKLDPKDFRFLGNRSYCYDRILQYDKALKDAEHAICLAPEWPKGYFRKGRAFAGMKMYLEAEQAFIHVLKLDAKCDDAVQELTRIRTQQIIEMGFTLQEAEAALVRYPTLQQAIDSLLSGLAGNGLSLHGSGPPGDTFSSSSHLINSRHSAAPPLHPIPPHHYQQAAQKILLSAVGGVDVKMDPANPEGLLALWVGNVLPEVSDKKLAQMFSKFGTVTSVRCLPDKFCAFVNFKDKDSAAKAMKNLQGTECAGQKLLIKFPDNPVTAGNVVIKKVVSTLPNTVATVPANSNVVKKGSVAAATTTDNKNKQQNVPQRFKK